MSRDEIRGHTSRVCINILLEYQVSAIKSAFVLIIRSSFTTMVEIIEEEELCEEFETDVASVSDIERSLLPGNES